MSNNKDNIQVINNTLNSEIIPRVNEFKLNKENSTDSIKSNSSIGKEKIYGKIHLILGPMFSGKSTELLRLVRRFYYKRKTTICVSYARDNRYSENDVVVTHDLTQYPAVKAKDIASIRDKIDQYDVIGIDEGQFYPDLVEQCEELCNMGKIVIIAALSGNFKRESFDTIARIIPKSDIIQNVNAICFDCNEEANFTLRLTNETSEVLIGGEESYKSACRACHEKYTNKRIVSQN